MSSSDEETSTLVDEDDYSINQGRKRRDSTKSKKNKPASRKKPRPPSGKRRKSQSSRKPKGRNRKEREPAPSSRVERLAKRIEGRQNGRVEITLDVRKAFVKGCRKLADRSGAKEVFRISLEDLQEFKEATAEAVRKEKSAFRGFKTALGFLNVKVQLLAVLEKAEDMVEENHVDDWFYYQDFNSNYTVVIPSTPWMRGGLRTSVFWLLMYYSFTPLVFCTMKDANICPNFSADPLASFVTTAYFASATLSTVGYGDFSPDSSTFLKALVGSLYMLTSNIILIVILNALLDLAAAKNQLDSRAKKTLLNKKKEHEFLYKKIRRFRNTRYLQVATYFTVVNVLGVVAHLVLNSGTDNLTDPDAIMRGFYWAVQTTTTIGYGDLGGVADTIGQQTFLIFYLIISTACVAQALGMLGSLREDMDEARRRFAWERRNMSKSLISEIAADDATGQVDEFKFVVASLLQLKKASSQDVQDIMNKFRALSKGADELSATEVIAEQQATPAELEKEENSYFVPGI